MVVKIIALDDIIIYSIHVSSALFFDMSGAPPADFDAMLSLPGEIVAV